MRISNTIFKRVRHLKKLIFKKFKKKIIYYFQFSVKYIDQENYIESIRKFQKYMYLIENYITYMNISLERIIFKL